MGEEEAKAASGDAPESGEASKAPPPVAAEAAEEPPEWLPDGWTMEVRMTKSGTKYRYYVSPVSGYRFRSRKEVLRYLSMVNVDDHVSETTSSSGEKKQKLIAQAKDSPEWLPSGWILEIRIQMSGETVGHKYKCYYDPFTGCRFYSKADIVRFLKSGELLTAAPKRANRKKGLSANATDNVLAQIEYSPNGLPHGWIKETKFRKSKDSNKCRRDPYYIDPISGYTFRTLKDAVHYLETGEISKYAIKPRKRSIMEMYSLEKESPPPIPLEELKSQGSAVRRCLFIGAAPKDGGEAMEICESPVKLELPPLDHASSQSVKSADAIHLNPDIKDIEGMTKKRMKVRELATENTAEPSKREKRKKKRGRPKKNRGRPKKFFSKLLEPEKLREKQSEPSNEILRDHLEKKHLELAVVEQLELSDERTSRFSSWETQETTDVTSRMLLIENSPENENAKDLDAKNEKPKTKESELLEPSSKKLLGPEEILLDPENENSSLPEVMEMDETLELLIEKPLEQENVKHLEPKSEILEPETGKSSPIEEKQTSGDKGVKNPKRCKANAKKTVILPRRASKRLAGLKPAVTGLETDRRPPRRSVSNSCHRFEDSLPCEEHKSMESAAEQASLRPQEVVAGKLADDKMETPIELPFGDTWLDPCIEFAVKTLTGDIPVLENGISIEDYFQQQLISVESSSPSAPAELAFDNKEGFKQATIPAQPEPPEQHKLSGNDERRSSSIGNRLPSSGKVIQEPRRSARLNH